MTRTERASLGDSIADQSPVEQFQTLHQIAAELTQTICSSVLDPVVKSHYESDTGTPVTQVLPDQTDEYEFSAGEFSALLLPDERRTVNHAFEGRSISPRQVLRDPERLGDCIEAAESLWIDTFGEFDPHTAQTGHPGVFPLSEMSVGELLPYVNSLYDVLLEQKSLDVVVEAARNGQYGFLATVFDTTETEILTPGGTDLAALPRSDKVHAPYNDGELAVLRPMTTGSRQSGTTPTRGVVVGHDDTPVGIFAHVIDVTNLNPAQTVGYETVRDAMGFDRELDPWTDQSTLHVDPDERVRLQGDLRVEYTGELDGFAAELETRRQITGYRSRVQDLLSSVSIDGRYVRQRRSDVPVTSVLDTTVSPDGDVTLEPLTDDLELELLGYVTLLIELESGPAAEVANYESIPYVQHPQFVWDSMATIDPAIAVQRAHESVVETIETDLASRADAIETEAKETAAEAEARLEAPQQVNLPIDNHMAFVESGFAPDVDTEPVPVAVPETSTLHIVHGEHNTVTVQIRPGVYRFSLLPRGLQPADTRPQWPDH